MDRQAQPNQLQHGTQGVGCRNQLGQGICSWAGGGRRAQLPFSPTHPPVSLPPSLPQLLFRTLDRDLALPNANDDYIAPLFR